MRPADWPSSKPADLPLTSLQTNTGLKNSVASMQIWLPMTIASPSATEKALRMPAKIIKRRIAFDRAGAVGGSQHNRHSPNPLPQPSCRQWGTGTTSSTRPTKSGQGARVRRHLVSLLSINSTPRRRNECDHTACSQAKILPNNGKFYRHPVTRRPSHHAQGSRSDLLDRRPSGLTRSADGVPVLETGRLQDRPETHISRGTPGPPSVPARRYPGAGWPPCRAAARCRPRVGAVRRGARVRPERKSRRCPGPSAPL